MFAQISETEFVNLRYVRRVTFCAESETATLEIDRSGRPRDNETVVAEGEFAEQLHAELGPRQVFCAGQELSELLEFSTVAPEGPKIGGPYGYGDVPPPAAGVPDGPPETAPPTSSAPPDPAPDPPAGPTEPAPPAAAE